MSSGRWALQTGYSVQLVLICVTPSLCRVQPAVVLLCTAAIFFLAEAIHAEPLLTCVVAGAVTTNRRWAVTWGSKGMCNSPA